MGTEDWVLDSAALDAVKGVSLGLCVVDGVVCSLVMVLIMVALVACSDTLGALVVEEVTLGVALGTVDLLTLGSLVVISGAEVVDSGTLGTVDWVTLGSLVAILGAEVVVSGTLGTVDLVTL